MDAIVFLLVKERLLSPSLRFGDIASLAQVCRAFRPVGEQFTYFPYLTKGSFRAFERRKFLSWKQVHLLTNNHWKYFLELMAFEVDCMGGIFLPQFEILCVDKDRTTGYEGDPLECTSYEKISDCTLHNMIPCLHYINHLPSIHTVELRLGNCWGVAFEALVKAGPFYNIRTLRVYDLEKEAVIDRAFFYAFPNLNTLSLTSLATGKTISDILTFDQQPDCHAWFVLAVNDYLTDPQSFVPTLTSLTIDSHISLFVPILGHLRNELLPGLRELTANVFTTGGAYSLWPLVWQALTRLDSLVLNFRVFENFHNALIGNHLLAPLPATLKQFYITLVGEYKAGQQRPSTQRTLKQFETQTHPAFRLCVHDVEV